VSGNQPLWLKWLASFLALASQFPLLEGKKQTPHVLKDKEMP
jgi:hypothetical protein